MTSDAKRPVAKAVNPSGDAPPSFHGDTRPGTILLVDDEFRQRDILKDFLQLNGFTVVMAASGEEALERLPDSSPGVVLLDLKMPGMGGLCTLKKIRESHPTLPVIIITQVDEDQVMEEALGLGAYDYLIKPFKFEQLKSVLLTKIFA